MNFRRISSNDGIWLHANIALALHRGYRLNKRLKEFVYVIQWRNDDLQRMRQNVGQAERKWRHTRLVVHRQIYTNLRDTFKQSISSAKSDYYCAKIESSSGNTKDMYHITNDLMGRSRQTVVPKCDGGPLNWLNPSSPSSLTRLLISVHA